MRTAERLVMCGGIHQGRKAGAQGLALNLHGPRENVHLRISDIGKHLVLNVPDVLVDLLEIASYVYAADSAIPRGGPTDAGLGQAWRRKLLFEIPVRRTNVWSSGPLLSALVDTLGFLSDDDYRFEFRNFPDPPL